MIVTFANPISCFFIRRYIYGFEIDYELVDLYESYLAADKYLLNHFSKAFFEYIQGRLDEESSCLIYDQLIKIGEREEIPFASVRTMIIEHSQKTLESEHFTQIDQETLISLLSLDQLSVDEINLLVAVSKWIDCEVQRQGLPVNRENRRRVFEPIKGYILFTALTPEKIANHEEIAELFTPDEIGLLFLHLLNKRNPLMIELKTLRRAGARVCCVFVTDFVSVIGDFYSNRFHLAVNRRVSILTIYSTYSNNITTAILSLKILDSNGVDLGLKPRVSFKEGKLCFSFDQPFDVEPNIFYILQFAGHGNATREDHLSQQQQLNYKESIIFYLNSTLFKNYHCIRGIEFMSLD